MKVDGNLSANWQEIPEDIRRLEELGYDGVGTAELAHDPFFPLLLAAEHSKNIELHESEHKRTRRSLGFRIDRALLKACT